jgi:acyl-CoA thioester hydrolase
MNGGEMADPLWTHPGKPEVRIAAPFRSSIMQVEPSWIDYNGHLNMAYYNVLFDRAVDEFYEALGIGQDYLTRQGRSLFTAEVHLRYLRELHADDPVYVTIAILGADLKRLHYFEQVFHAGEEWVAATSENMALHVDMSSRKTAPFEPADMGRINAVVSAHAALPRPDAAGRRIAMPS